MASPDEELTVAQRLGRALDRGLLPAGGPAEAAERLIERLERPARIALLGLPGSGKSSILNLLVGTVVVPETLRLPTIIVQHGASARMVCTLTDGSTKVLAGSDLAEVLPFAPALVTLEMDLAALKVISLLEVSAGPMEAEQKRAATWASKRADIVIWCTTSYLPKEQVVWESLPDAVKDNSFMFLTKVDLLGSRQQASAMHDRVELRAGEEFRQILSISAKEARTAMPPGGPVNRDLFRDSGATAVIAAIKTRVQSGRRADTDTAELLLARHVEASELVARRFAEPDSIEETRQWTPPPDAEEPAGAAAAEFADTADAVDSPIDEEPFEVEAAGDEAAEDEVDETPQDWEDEADEPEPDELEFEPDPEPEPDHVEPEPEDRVAAEFVADDDLPQAEKASDTQPDADADPRVSPGLSVPSPVVADAVSRRRFADRIKRVASETDAAPAAMVPLRSTWKSKTELETPPPVSAPTARATDPVRRPRAAPQPDDDEGDVARMLASITNAPDEPASPTRPAVPRDRPARAITPRPVADADAPRPSDVSASPARPKLFGAARDAIKGLSPGSPLPDLSSLRARPEDDEDRGDQEQDLTVDSEGLAETSDTIEVEAVAVEEVFVQEIEPEAEPEVQPEADLAAEPEQAVEVDRVNAQPAKPATPIERPKLFGRSPRAAAAEPQAPAPPEVQLPRITPISRLPASARVAAPPPSSPPAATADDAQFTPRAIMMRDRRDEAEAPIARRERPRIAARAVPQTAAPAAPAQDTGADQGLAAEAIAVLLARSAELEREIDPDAKIPVDLILDHARETGEQVAQVVSRGKTDAMRRINSDLGEVLDLIMLMQLEKGHAPADDALTLLLQLRRELETLRAV